MSRENSRTHASLKSLLISEAMPGSLLTISLALCLLHKVRAILTLEWT